MDEGSRLTAARRYMDAALNAGNQRMRARIYDQNLITQELPEHLMNRTYVEVYHRMIEQRIPKTDAERMNLSAWKSRRAA